MDPRRMLIADSALTLIGRDGIRALTHHGIDDEAGLARGSTSYYCRKRVDMLRLALERLYVLDHADLSAAGARVGDARTQDAIEQSAAEMIVDWLTGDARLRSVARIELFMAASHEPELQPLLAEQLAGMRFAAMPLLVGEGEGAVQRLAAAFMLLDGLVLAVLREGRPAPTTDEIRALLATLR